MTLIATDLDRTLIFSEKFASRHPSELALSPCELYQGRNVSLIADSVRDALPVLAQHATFVPSTTRTKAQYDRLSLGVAAPWVICCSGGQVLRRRGGVLVADAAWDAHVRSLVAAECASRDEVAAMLSAYADAPWLREVREAEQVFLIAIVDPSCLPVEDLATITAAGTMMNWRVAHQGGKMYLVPRVVTKAEAVARVRAELAGSGSAPRVLAAGDSVLDWDMLCHADAGWTAADGELAVLARERGTVARTVRGGVESSLDVVAAWAVELGLALPGEPDLDALIGDAARAS